MEQSSGDITPVVLDASSTEVPVEDRFDWWCDAVDRNIAPFEILTAHTRDYRARIRGVDLGTTRVAKYSFAPLLGTRSPAHIRRGDPETYTLVMVNGGPLQASQRRNEAAIESGGLILFDTSHPMKACYPGSYGRPCEATFLTLPKNLFPLPAGRTDRLLSQQLSPAGVTGTLMCQYLTTMVDRAADLGPATAHRLGAVALDLAASLVADHLDAAPLLPTETRRQVLLARINAFIDGNLGDPDLRPAHIAAHHHLSVRALHQLFRTEPETVSATIRRRRLERCRRDLADPQLRDHPLAALAARWGFLLPAEFSRVFRAAYGMTPREFRHEAAVRRAARRMPDESTP
ncbi:helix-turn-helix domain-containing protein [Streptomyces sp. BR123]|uniref:AraC-like ligand-binding domain-containing protein n=1 Tax=Streptomyces sp. BR123 TaxID=2749828 RepID=UPI0015C4A0B5|nr:helix-turn-helix domain-containing protein [Streptomyces sp. BR123]NXY97528.1 helix-turn-helix domain-containing protein [Streptomyces sp. BR123]